MDADELVTRAKGESVTKKLLTDSGKVRSGVLSKTSYSSIISHLNEGEQPHFVARFDLPENEVSWADGQKRFQEGKKRTTVITDRRLLFYSTSQNYSVVYGKVSEVQEESGNLVVTTDGGTKAAFPLTYQDRDEAVEYVQEQVHESQSTGAIKESDTDHVSRMEELTKMHSMGLIDEQEFAEKREDILDKL